MRPVGIRIQVGRTYLQIQAPPFDWLLRTELSSPRMFGFGIWLTRSVW